VSVPEVPVLNGVHVLLVDDNDDARAILQSYLQHVGANVTTARSGGEALGMLQEVAAHVIISDNARDDRPPVSCARPANALRSREADTGDCGDGLR
jgi:CheY-like chemotaxis protein